MKSNYIGDVEEGRIEEMFRVKYLKHRENHTV